ncbi:DnaD domain protein [Alkalibacterium sp. s-m-22]|uniref:DnaD domain protein n=1 Tax=Alkalibacterium indicireducens TaxID=398758 RepID=A0ABP3KBS9_9LACT
MTYPWKTMSPKDSVHLIRLMMLSDLHIKALHNLYQPLLGKDAVSLFMTLKETLDQTIEKDVMLSDLLVQLDCGVKEFYEARIRLEAYGLIRVYVHDSDSTRLAIGLSCPMLPEQFFKDPMMKMMLTEKVGERLTDDLQKRFKVHDGRLNEYKEVTKSFLDVIHVDMKKMSEASENEDAEERSTAISDQIMATERFDWSFFIEGLNKNYISRSSITTDLKRLIYTFHALYNINELEMQKFVLEVADLNTGQVDDQKLTSLIQKEYLKKSGSSRKTADVLTQESEHRVRQLEQKGFSKEEIEIILHSEQVSPYAYLKSIKRQKGGFVSSNETWLLKELVENAPLTTAVINILLNYLLIIKNSPSIEKGLATKIANDWAQSQVKTPEDAMEKVKQLYASFGQKNQKAAPKGNYSKTQKNGSHARQETLPDWALEGSVKDERLSSEEEEAYKERLKRIRNRKSGES